MVKKRSIFFDNYKGVLITLVVLGHFLYTYFLNTDNNYASIITVFIYIFHMPAFIFTTGFLSKSENVFKKKSFVKLIIIYFIFNTFMSLFSYMINGDSIYLLTPKYSYWYLLSVIYWRLIIRYVENIKGLLPFSIIISLLIGFYPDVDNTLSIVRTITFFPFFVLGYKYDFKNLKNFFIKNSKIKLLFISLLTSFFFTALLFEVSKYGFSSRQLLYFSYKTPGYLFIRIFLMILAFISLFLLYITIPNKKLPFITKWGKNCLLIYLIHRPITIIFNKIFPYQNYGNIYVIYSLISAFVLLFIFGSDKLNTLFNKTIEFITNKFINSNRIKYIIIISLIAFLLIKPIGSIMHKIINDNDIFSFKAITNLIK